MTDWTAAEIRELQEAVIVAANEDCLDEALVPILQRKLAAALAALEEAPKPQQS